MANYSNNLDDTIYFAYCVCVVEFRNRVYSNEDQFFTSFFVFYRFFVKNCLPNPKFIFGTSLSVTFSNLANPTPPQIVLHGWPLIWMAFIGIAGEFSTALLTYAVVVLVLQGHLQQPY